MRQAGCLRPWASSPAVCAVLTCQPWLVGGAHSLVLHNTGVVNQKGAADCSCSVAAPPGSLIAFSFQEGHVQLVTTTTGLDAACVASAALPLMFAHAHASAQQSVGTVIGFALSKMFLLVLHKVRRLLFFLVGGPVAGAAQVRGVHLH